MPALVVVFPRYACLEPPGEGEALGRAWLAARGISDTLVSSRHLLFLRQPGEGLAVMDAKSRNGSWLNGSRLEPEQRAALADTAVLRVGQQVMVYVEELVGEPEPDEGGEAIVGPWGLRRVEQQLRALDGARHHVLVEGEEGTGKSTFAREIAARAGRGDQVVAVRAAEVADVGAWFGAAEGGVLVVEDVDELPVGVRGQMAAALAERPGDAMVIGTTRTDLATQVELGILPAELVRALAGVRIELPPLRERKEDIRALMRAVVAREKLAIDFGREEEAHAIERLLLHPWRRNAWELEEVMREVALVAPGPLTIAGMQQVIGSVAVARTARVVTDAEVLEAYADCGEHERRAARALEMSVERFRMRMRRLGTLAAHD